MVTGPSFCEYTCISAPNTPRGSRPAGTPVPFYLPGRSESAPGARGRVRPYIWSVSSRIVTGPSFCEYTCISAPERPTGLRPAGTGSLYLPGRVNPPRHRGFWPAKTLGRAGGAGRVRPYIWSVSSRIVTGRSANTPACPRRTPPRGSPRGDPGSFYLPGRSESAPASRFWLRQNRTRRGRGGEFGPTSGRCPAEWSPVRRSASTPACRRRTRRAPPGSPARRTRP